MPDKDKKKPKIESNYLSDEEAELLDDEAYIDFLVTAMEFEETDGKESDEDKILKEFGY